jgi:tetratricopeptide (TPR) repeat protein
MQFRSESTNILVTQDQLLTTSSNASAGDGTFEANKITEAKILYSKQEYEKAEEIFLMLLPMLEKVKHCRKKAWEDLAVVHNILGITELKLGKYERSLWNLNAALRIRLDHKDSSRKLAQVYESLAMLFKVLKKYEKAKENLLQAYALHNTQIPRDSMQVASILLKIGELLVESKQYSEAANYYEKILDEDVHRDSRLAEFQTLAYSFLSLIYGIFSQ